MIVLVEEIAEANVRRGIDVPGVDIVGRGSDLPQRRGAELNVTVWAMTWVTVWVSRPRRLEINCGEGADWVDW